MNRTLLFASALLPALLAGPGDAAPPEPDGLDRIVKNGVSVDFHIAPVNGKGSLKAGELAEVRFAITEEGSGKPIRGADPGAWMDMSQVIRAQTGARQKSCKDKVSLYMQGAVGIRPVADLNGYNVLVMNAEPSLSVVDPTVSMAGRTSTLASVRLTAPGADWAKSGDQKRLYVSTPESGKLAVVDLDNFKLVANIEAGRQPTRTAIQPDGRYLWVADDASGSDTPGVRVLDTASERIVAEIVTGRGHHEIAFSADSRLALVSNRGDGTVSVIDTGRLARIADLGTGPLPIALAYSPLAKAFYVADGEAGTVSVYAEQKLERLATIGLKPGLGPLRFTPDGRHALVVNPSQDAVYVIDAAANTLAHTISVKGEPYAVAMSQAFAYVRALKSERVSMIALRSLGHGGTPTVQSFAAGDRPPAEAGRLALADGISAANSEASVFVVNPADNTTYFYMEGMNAASSNYQVMGGSARAVTVVDRSLKEIEPGVYAGKVRLPADGRYDVAFMMQTPQLLHCFSAQVEANPMLTTPRLPLRVLFDESQRRVTAGQTVTLRLRIFDGATGEPRTGIGDAKVLHFLAPGRLRTEAALKEVGGGEYEFRLPALKAGAYYIHLAVPSLRLDYGALPYFSVLARPEESAAVPSGADGG